MLRFMSALCILCFSSIAVLAETVSFKAADGLEITADFQKPDGSYNAIIVLFHMAGASRGEYRDIAPILNKLGYATLAVDQRSGGAFNGIKNETVGRAGGGLGYAKAIPDLEAASKWARANSGARLVGVLGSSYSSSLVLVMAGKDPQFADAVMSFSPGEYFGDRQFVSKALPGIGVPVFLSAARGEAGQWKPFESKIKSSVTGFVPKGGGRHGATALISNDGEEYWVALKAFLAEHLPAQ